MRLDDIVGCRLAGTTWLDDVGLVVTCVRKNLDPAGALHGGAFEIRFFDAAWMQVDQRVVFEEVVRVAEADPDAASLRALGGGPSEAERADLRVYAFHGPGGAAPVLRVLASGVRIREVPARGW